MPDAASGTAPAGVIPGFSHGDPAPAGLSDEELRAYEQLSTFYAEHVAYSSIMSTRPQTMYGLADSPIDLAAFAINAFVTLFVTIGPVETAAVYAALTSGAFHPTAEGHAIVADHVMRHVRALLDKEKKPVVEGRLN